MPELPDLEVFKDNIFKKLTSKHLIDVRVFNANKVNVPQAYLLKALQGAVLLNVGRVGKELIFNFSDQRVVAVHLMLNGKVGILNGCDGIGDVKFKIFSFGFENETIVFSDVGGLCTVKYMPSLGEVPDAFDAAFTLAYFLGAAGKKS